MHFPFKDRRKINVITSYSIHYTKLYDFRESLADAQPSAELLEQVPIGFTKAYRIFPLGLHGRNLQVAVADPFDARPLNDLSTLTRNNFV